MKESDEKDIEIRDVRAELYKNEEEIHKMNSIIGKMPLIKFEKFCLKFFLAHYVPGINYKLKTAPWINCLLITGIYSWEWRAWDHQWN